MTTGAEINSKTLSVPLQAAAADKKPTVVVIGNGMVGQRFCDLMTEGDTSLARVVTFSEEGMPAYDRVHLSEYFAGKTGDALCLANVAWYAERGIELFLGERATHIDR